MTLYPLRFQPILRRYLWGGRRLESLLNKPLGDGDDYAESWEIVDHGEDQSVVTGGPLAGQTLAEIIRQDTVAVFGGQQFQSFPLLFKFLDAHRHLSVQVHPNDQQGALLDPPDAGKTEAWVVLHAEPESVIYAGLLPGVDRARLVEHIERGTTEHCLHQIRPKPGDCIFLPAGVVHAIGAGLVIAEIQQASDTTFRLFDWNRVDQQGKARPLHIDQALSVIDFAAGPVRTQVPTRVSEQVERLVGCDKFVLERHRLSGTSLLGRADRFQIVSVLDGCLAIEADPLEQPLRIGETVLLPASISPVSVTALEPTSALVMYVD